MIFWCFRETLASQKWSLWAYYSSSYVSAFRHQSEKKGLILALKLGAMIALNARQAAYGGSTDSGGNSGSRNSGISIKMDLMASSLGDGSSPDVVWPPLVFHRNVEFWYFPAAKFVKVTTNFVKRHFRAKKTFPINTIVLCEVKINIERKCLMYITPISAFKNRITQGVMHQTLQYLLLMFY